MTCHIWANEPRDLFEFPPRQRVFGLYKFQRNNSWRVVGLYHFRHVLVLSASNAGFCRLAIAYAEILAQFKLPNFTFPSMQSRRVFDDPTPLRSRPRYTNAHSCSLHA